jgi:hypothetical protein
VVIYGMDAPAAARLWRRYWFKCPHCGMGQFSVHALVKSSGFRYGDSVVFYSFWCSICGRYSGLRSPALLGLALVAVPTILFLVFYMYFAWLGWWMVFPALFLGVLLKLCGNAVADSLAQSVCSARGNA